MAATVSGTIAYFKVRVGAAPTGCTNDSGCWAIYEDTGGPANTTDAQDPVDGNYTPGALKASGCFSGYNWTTDGIGDHSFDVTNTGTNLTITQGNFYTFVLWSYATDSTEYGTANCNDYIGKYRGKSGDGCADDVLGLTTVVFLGLLLQTQIMTM